jgi:hypothetical protein
MENGSMRSFTIAAAAMAVLMSTGAVLAGQCDAVNQLGQKCTEQCGTQYASATRGMKPESEPAFKALQVQSACIASCNKQYFCADPNGRGK